MRNWEHNGRESESIQKCLENQGTTRNPLQSLVKEIERNKERSEKADRLEILRRGQGRHPGLKKARHEPRDKGSNKNVDTSGIADDRADDSYYKQEGEF